MVVGLTVSLNCMYCFIWSLVAVIRKHDVKWLIFVSSMSRSSSWCFRIRLHKCSMYLLVFCPSVIGSVAGVGRGCVL